MNYLFENSRNFDKQNARPEQIKNPNFADRVKKFREQVKTEEFALKLVRSATVLSLTLLTAGFTYANLNWKEDVAANAQKHSETTKAFLLSELSHQAQRGIIENFIK